jgi:hypothetical protein
MSKAKGDPPPSRVHKLGRMSRTELIARFNDTKAGKSIGNGAAPDPGKMSNEQLAARILDDTDGIEW